MYAQDDMFVHIILIICKFLSYVKKGAVGRTIHPATGPLRGLYLKYEYFTL